MKREQILNSKQMMKSTHWLSGLGWQFRMLHRSFEESKYCWPDSLGRCWLVGVYLLLKDFIMWQHECRCHVFINTKQDIPHVIQMIMSNIWYMNTVHVLTEIFKSLKMYKFFYTQIFWLAISTCKWIHPWALWLGRLSPWDITTRPGKRVSSCGRAHARLRTWDMSVGTCKKM